jgi:hypothetical protein
MDSSLPEEIDQKLADNGVSEREVLGDFATSRRRR